MGLFKKLFDKHEYLQVQIPTKEEYFRLKERCGLNDLGIESALVQAFADVVRNRLERYEREGKV